MILACSVVIEVLWLSQSWLVGRPRTAVAGWIVGIVQMLLWIPFAVLTGGYAFIVGALVGTVVYSRNLHLARSTCSKPD